MLQYKTRPNVQKLLQAVVVRPMNNEYRLFPIFSGKTLLGSSWVGAKQ